MFRTTLRPNFYVLQNFHHKLANLVAPPTDGTAKCLVRCKVAVFAVARCPSVCPSRSCILFRWLKISSNFFVVQVAHHSNFWTPSADIRFQGEPVQRGRKIQGWENFAIFELNRRLSRKRYEIGRWLLWNKSWVPDRIVSFSMTLSDPNSSLKVTVYLQVE